MDADQAIANLARLLSAVESSQEVSGELLTLVRAQRERLDELAEDVAELGSRVSQLERERRNESSLRVVGREHFASLDELAAVLRAEVADEFAAVSKRITEVHDPALRALTALVERKHPA